MKLKTAVIATSIYRDGDSPLFGNTAIKVALEDEAAGAFLVISQESEEHTGKIIVELEELRAVLATAEKMIAEYPE